MDGVPGYSQEPVQPGETFTYDFVVPDAGIYWYHPHVMSAEQVGFGLYGAFLVDDPAERVGIADDLVLVLSDIDVTDDGELLPSDTGGTVGMLFGREGNRVLVNGRRLPELVARAGAPQRWRIVNAAKSRYFNLDLGEGHVFRKIGGDGGLTEYSEDHDFIVLGAGERADVLVTPTGESGGEGLLRSLLHDRGYGSIFGRDFENLLTIRFADEPPHDPGPLPHTRREMVPWDLEGATAIDLELTLQEDPYDQSFAYGIKPRALLEGEADPRGPRRDAGLDGDQLHRVVASPAPARLLLPGPRRDRRAGPAPGVEGHGGHPPRPDGAPGGPLRRPPRHLDLPLPHPRSRRRGAPERGAPRPAGRDVQQPGRALSRGRRGRRPPPPIRYVRAREDEAPPHPRALHPCYAELVLRHEPDHHGRQ